MTTTTQPISTATARAAARLGLVGVSLPRPRLTVVPRLVRRTRHVPFVVLVVAVLAAGLVGLLLLNTSMERGAFQVTSMRDQTAALSVRQQALELQVAALQRPQNVAERAVALGMVQDPSPAFLKLSTGSVLGHSAPGVKGDGVVGISAGHASTAGSTKVMPLDAGQANSATSGLVVHRGPHAKHAKVGDTATTSHAAQH